MLLFLLSFSINAANIQRLDYEGFTVWLDCEKRGAVKFQYNAQRDTGNFKRKTSFYYDPGHKNTFFCGDCDDSVMNKQQIRGKCPYEPLSMRY